MDITRTDVVKSSRLGYGWRGSSNFALSELVNGTFDTLDPPVPFHTKRCGIASAGRAAVAAQKSFIILNISGLAPTNFRCVVREIHAWVGGAAAAPARIGIDDNNDANVGGAAYSLGGTYDADQRTATLTGATVAQVGATTSAGDSLANNNDILFTLLPSVAAGDQKPAIITRPWILTPGFSLVIQCQTLNLDLNAAFFYDEFYIA